MILIDANVLLDVIERDAVWGDRSRRQMSIARDQDLLAINPIIYAEVANAFDDEASLKAYFSPTDFDRQALPWEAAFVAGRAFMAYRKRGGNKTAPLPDFFIGAHAQVTGLTLLTRDPARYRTYFPKVKLITP